METQITQMIISTLFQEVGKMMANPETAQALLQFFGGGCHNHVDVAQDALDAYDHGHLTRDQAMRIVQICLEQDARDKGQPIDIKAKRIQIEQLFTK